MLKLNKIGVPKYKRDLIEKLREFIRLKRNVMMLCRDLLIYEKDRDSRDRLKKMYEEHQLEIEALYTVIKIIEETK